MCIVGVANSETSDNNSVSVVVAMQSGLGTYRGVYREQLISSITTPRVLPVFNSIGVDNVAEIRVRDLEVSDGITAGFVSSSISFIIATYADMTGDPEQYDFMTIGGKIV